MLVPKSLASVDPGTGQDVALTDNRDRTAMIPPYPIKTPPMPTDPHFDTGDLATLRDWVRWGASQFNAAGLHFGHGTDNALDESLWLVLHALHLNHQLPDAYLDARLTTEESESVLQLLRRRLDERLPAAYLTGKMRFMGLDFYVDSRVLVPRSPLAELIETGFEPWLEPEQVPAILDIGTGSACIAIACAYAFPEAEVHATDLSPDALAVAEKNRALHELEDRLHLHQADVWPEDPSLRFDLIISNPPYVAQEEYDQLPAEYAHEPGMGLAAPDQGLAVVERILTGAAKRLTDGGILVVEVGSSAQTVLERWPEVPFLWLDFARGGDGVFLLTADQVQQYFN